MSQISIVTASDRTHYSVTPLEEQHSFPDFTEIEINAKGEAIGWVMGQPKDLKMQSLGSPGVGAVVVSHSEKEIVFKKK